MTNTRFNPTANGNLHLGHLYLILLNYYEAKRNGGKFIVRFDDDQAYWIQKIGREKINRFCEEMKEDLLWLDIKPNLYSYESKEKDRNEKYIQDLKCLDNAQFTLTNNKFAKRKIICPQIRNMEKPYNYSPYLTAVKVVQDWREGCGILIRGDDLVSEFSLYCYFCKCLNLPVPKFYYVPKLMQCHKGKADSLLDLCGVSKTQGNFKLRDFKKKGYSPKQLIDLLEDVCLIDKNRGWTYNNIKHQPVINL